MYFSISKETFEFWADEIVGIWRKETANRWYQRSGKSSKVATGKLYTRYTAKLRKVKPGVEQFEKDEALEKKANELDACDQFLAELALTSVDDINKTKSLWEKTFPIRNPGGNIAAYYESYPQLRPPLGCQLVRTTNYSKLFVNLIIDVNWK